MNMFKNIIITILTLGIIVFWLQGDEEDFDPDSVTIEYRCSILDAYDNVPPEVSEECKSRNKDEPQENVDK
jgi:hypothetical protein